MIAFRDAEVADAAALARLGAESFTETFGHLYDPADLAAFLENHRATSWAAQLGDPAFAVRLGEAEGRAVAYAKLGPPSLPFTPNGPAAELRQFYILRPWQGSGAAQALMDWVLSTARARGAEELYLSVFVDNHRARRFYARYGFVEVGSYDFMVGTHRDEDHIMRLAL
ncbi:N-acetyltransferase [Sphingomonas metalli]|uniref:N-acetyltransferase n=1 Tax=Sphingomonas metalli TaxID=1779358 RepID=A0A916TBV5_9SPHN|nr:GNAT family N-acetyltransferase [Sphingomonas metalli]GGB38975.1 N-acetyltransferase [Sphingomonas metalli]